MVRVWARIRANFADMPTKLACSTVQKTWFFGPKIDFFVILLGEIVLMQWLGLVLILG